MAKQSTRKSTATHWIETVDPDAVSDARDEALTDAFGDSEQHTAFLTVRENERRFPFKATDADVCLTESGV